MKDRVEKILGSYEKATIWLKSPNRALGGQKPEQLVRNKSGRKRVLQVLGRIEHGVYS